MARLVELLQCLLLKIMRVLPGFARRIHATWGPYFSSALSLLYLLDSAFRPMSLWRATLSTCNSWWPPFDVIYCVTFLCRTAARTREEAPQVEQHDGHRQHQLRLEERDFGVNDWWEWLSEDKKRKCVPYLPWKEQHMSKRPEKLHKYSFKRTKNLAFDTGTRTLLSEEW